MSNYIFTQQQMTTLADNIRSLTGSSDTLNISEMQQEIALSLKEVVVPEGVTTVNASYFTPYPGMTSVKFPSTLLSIADNTFENNTLLESVVFKATEVTIGDDAFTGCSNLKYIEGHVNNLHTITAQAYEMIDYTAKVLAADDNRLLWEQYGDASCNIKKIEIAEGITTIAHGCFYSCNDLIECVLPDSLKIIEYLSFPHSHSAKLQYNTYQNGKYLGSKTNPYFCCVKAPWTNSIHLNCKILGDGFKSLEIQDSAYSYIPSNIISISYGAFENSKTTDIHLNQGLQYLNMSAFINCKNLTELVIPNTVIELFKTNRTSEYLQTISFEANSVMTSLDLNIFKFNTSLTNLSLPDHLTTLTFADLPLVSQLSIPATVTTISEYFGDSVHYQFNVDAENTVYESTSDGKMIIYKATHSVQHIMNTSSIVIPEGVDRIESTGRNINITSITFPSTLTRIQDSFNGCVFANNVTIPEGVKYIQYSFSNTIIPLLILPASLEYTNFDNYNDIQGIQINSNNQQYFSTIDNKCVTDSNTVLWVVDGDSIPEDSNIIRIQDGSIKCDYIKIPANITYIPTNYAPRQLLEIYNLSNIPIETYTNGLAKYARDIYSDPTNKKITRNNGFIVLDDDGTNILLKYTDQGLSTITVPNGIDKIESYAFNNCVATTYIIPETVSELEYCVISPYHSQDINVTIPFIGASINDTENDAFYAISGLNKVHLTILGGNISVNTEDNRLVELTLGPHILSIIEGAFSGYNLNKVTLLQNINNDGYIFGYLDNADVIIAEGVTAIGDYMLNNLYNCNISLPTTLTTIGEGAFTNSTINSINLNNVTTIGKDAFKESGLKGTLNLSSVTSFGEAAFKNNLIDAITLSSSLTTIPKDAFYGNVLGEIIIPDSIETIGQNAFGNCHCYKLTLGENFTSENLENSISYTDLIEVYNKSNYDLSGETRIKNIYTPLDGSSKLSISNNIVIYQDQDNYIYVRHLQPNNIISLTIPSNVTNVENNFIISSNTLTSIKNLTNQSFLAFFDSNSKFPHVSYYGGYNISYSLPYAITCLEIFDGATSVHFNNLHALQSFGLPNSVTSFSLGSTAVKWIMYNGTLSQWDNITKFKSYQDAIGIICTDGEITWW